MTWTYCILHLLVSFTALVMVDAQCRTEISIPGMALDGFVFKIMSATAPHQCEVHCEREITCQSYNYVIGEKICELNNRTKEARPQNFRSDPARFYIRRFIGRVTLGSIPELPAISCREIEASEGKYNISNRHWLHSSLTGQAELVDCSDTVKDCDANPCKNGGTCVEVPSKKTYKCNCTDAFTGKNCSESTNVAQSTDASPTVASLDRGNGQPQNGNDYDFELIFRKTQHTSYVKHDMNKQWITDFTVCAWIHTPDLQQSQKMTVISILNEKNGGNQNVVRLRIDGEGNIYFSSGSDGTSLSNVFATSSPKDEMVFLCVRIKPDKSSYIEAIVNADFGSNKTSDGVKYGNVQWTQVIIGQNQDNDGTITNDTPFYGRISNLNIWFNPFTDAHITNWYNGGKKNYKPNILKWPELGSSSRIGDVHFVEVTSAERQWRDVLDAEVVVKNTVNVVANKTVENGPGVVIEVERQSPPVSCTIDSATVDGVLISVSGSWKRIKYKQTFMETQKCFAIFGSVPNWASGIFNPGVSDFDLNLDELWKEEYLGPNGNHFDGVNALCGDEHFWMVNQPNTPVAGVSLRRKNGGLTAGISTFGKCGMFKFKISDIRVLE